MSMKSDKPTAKSTNPKFSTIKQTAKGRWPEILCHVGGFAESILDRKNHPCPKCGGTDRFRLINQDAGAVFCNQCFNSKNGDGIAAVAWNLKCSLSEAADSIGDYLEIPDQNGKAVEFDIIKAVCNAKRMPIDSLMAFGAMPAMRGQLKVARVPVYDETGNKHSHFDLVPDGKGWFKRGIGSSGLFLPGRVSTPGETWMLTEGVKDAAALHGLGFDACGLPSCQMNKKYSSLFKGCKVVLIHDLDSPSVNGFNKTARRLVGITSEVRIARLPGEIKSSDGDDVRDVLARTNGESLVRNAIKEASVFTIDEGGGLPPVIVEYDEATVADSVISRLQNLGWDYGDKRHRIYQRCGKLVHITSEVTATSTSIEIPTRMPLIRPLPASLLRERITQAVELIQDSDDARHTRPPSWLIQAILQRGEYPESIRPLAGLASAPVVRPDGSILQDPGYDEATKLYYEPTIEFERVAERPSIDQAREAVHKLLELVCDFPFTDESHKTSWLSLVLSLICRPAIPGPCPLFVFDANTRGSGKSLLCDVAGIIAFGTTAPRRAWSRDDDEVRKSITSVALEALPAITIDNVVSQLGSPGLDAALTGTTWTDRILGKSETTGTLPLTTIWMATGNNIVLAADTARRSLLCRLETLEEHPEDRADFKHPDLTMLVKKNRGTLAPAAATILTAYFAAGCPKQGLQPWGSYEAWSQIVRSAIVWCGFPDPAETRQLIRDADSTAEILARLLNGICEIDQGDGILANEIMKSLDETRSDKSDRFPALRSAIADICGAKVDSRRIGYRLRSYAGRVTGGRRLAARDSNAGKRWFVENLNVGGDEGDRGDVPADSEIDSEAIYSAGESLEVDSFPGETSPSSPLSPPNGRIQGRI